MNSWTLAGIIALIIIICAGTIIKFYTHSRIKEYDGTYDIIGSDDTKSEEPEAKEFEEESDTEENEFEEESDPEEKGFDEIFDIKTSADKDSNNKEPVAIGADLEKQEQETDLEESDPEDTQSK